MTLVDAERDRWAGMPGAAPGCWVPDPLPDHLARAPLYRRVLAQQRLCDQWGCTCDREGWAFQVLHSHSRTCELNPHYGSTLGAELARAISTPEMEPELGIVRAYYCVGPERRRVARQTLLPMAESPFFAR